MKTFCFEFWKKERKREKSYWDLNLNSLSKGVSHDLNILKTTVFFFLHFLSFILFCSRHVFLFLPPTALTLPPSPDLFPNLFFSHFCFVSLSNVANASANSFNSKSREKSNLISSRMIFYSFSHQTPDQLGF